MSCGCPEGFTYNSSTGLCDDLVRETVELNVTPVLPAEICTSPNFMRLGTVVYNPISVNQFPLLENPSAEVPGFIDGLGATILPQAKLIVGEMWISSYTNGFGRLNQAGIGLLPPLDEWQGYSSCVRVDGDEYAVAVSAQYGFRIYIDGELAVYYKPQPPVFASDYLHVFRFDLPDGPHNILFEGLSGTTLNRKCFDNYGGEITCGSVYAALPPTGCPNLGVLVGEVYRNITPQILSDIVTQEDLNAVYASRYRNNTGQYITTLILQGSPTDTGVNGNYHAGSGHISSCVEGRIVYEETIVEPYGACCFNLINCSSGAIIVTNSDVSSYHDKIIKINQAAGCYVININTTVPCPAPIAVTVSSFFDDCEECNKNYYKLIDCNGNIGPLYTNTDLSDYVSSEIIKIAGFEACWQVTPWVTVSNPVVVQVLSSYPTCESCA